MSRREKTESEERKSGFATASLIFGILALLGCWIPILNNIAFFLAIIAIIFAIISLIKKASKGVAIAGLIISILACVFVYQAQSDLSDSLDNLDGSNTQQILETSVDVQIGNFEVTPGEYVTDTKLPVTVTNKTSDTASFSIQIEAVNSDGSRITTDYVYANNLTAGQSQTFDIFTLVSSDEIEALQNATFNVVEASMY